MTKWEYRVFNEPNSGQLETKLTEAGAHGWEVIGFSAYGAGIVALAKRERTEKDKAAHMPQEG